MVKYFGSCQNPCLPLKGLRISMVDRNTFIYIKVTKIELGTLNFPLTCLLSMWMCVSDLTPSLLFKNDLQPTGTALSHTQTYSIFPSKC